MSEIIHDTGNAFTRKLGPLPTWAWAAIVVAVVWGLYAYRASRGTVKPVAGAGAPPDPGYTGGSLAGAVGGAGAQVTGINNGIPAMTTNAQWARQAADQLIAMGDDPTAVENALASYVSGQTLSSGGDSIIRQALTRFGQPPEGILPLHTGPQYVGFSKDLSNNALYGIDPTGHSTLLSYNEFKAAGGNTDNTQPFQSLTGFTWDKNGGALVAGQQHWGTSALPTPRQYTVTAGDTPASIAQRYTGDPSKASALLSANGGNITAGQKITIPF